MCCRNGEFVIASRHRFRASQFEELIRRAEQLTKELEAVLEESEALPDTARIEDLVQRGRGIAADFEAARNSGGKEKLQLRKRQSQADLLGGGPEDGDDLPEESDAHSGTSGGSSSKADDKRKKAKAKRRADTPEQLYQNDIRIGREGLLWERRVNMKYEEWLVAQQSNTNLQRETPEDDWPCPREGSTRCRRGWDSAAQDRVPCCRESCNDCFRAQKKERKNLRALAQKRTPWARVDKTVKQKYISYWINDHPLTDDAAVVQKGKYCDEVSEMARVVFANVWEPPHEDACVEINALDVELDIEAIMDKVTEAMSTDTVVDEVGEKTAFRRRLLMSHQAVKQLRFNRRGLVFSSNLFKMMVIIINFISVLCGTLTFKLHGYMER